MGRAITRRSSEIDSAAREKRRAGYRRTRVQRGIERLREAERKPKVARRKKPKYSRGTKDIQRLAYGMSKSSERVARAAADGLVEFNTRSKKSRRRSRDGAVRDSVKNASKGLEVGLQELSKAPRHLAKRVRTRGLWKGSRRAVALLGAPVSGLLR